VNHHGESGILESSGLSAPRKWESTTRITLLERGHKGAPLVLIRHWLRSDVASYRRFLAGLAPRDRDRFESFTASDWVSIDFASSVYTVAAPLLYPGIAAPLRRLGREICKDNISGLFRFVLRTLTVPFLIGQTARVWHSFHVAGVPSLERTGDRALHFMVRDYPELSAEIRETIAGFITELIERTGAKDVRIRSADDDPSCWGWWISWR